MAEFKLEDVQKFATDSLYVTIGLGVIAFQKAQVRRQELKKQFEENAEGTRKVVEDRLKTVEERLGAIESRVDDALDEFESKLPEQARTAVSQARTVAKDARKQVLGLVDGKSA